MSNQVKATNTLTITTIKSGKPVESEVLKDGQQRNK